MRRRRRERVEIRVEDGSYMVEEDDYLCLVIEVRLEEREYFLLIEQSLLLIVETSITQILTLIQSIILSLSLSPFPLFLFSFSFSFSFLFFLFGFLLVEWSVLSVEWHFE